MTIYGVRCRGCSAINDCIRKRINQLDSVSFEYYLLGVHDCIDSLSSVTGIDFNYHVSFDGSPNRYDC